MPCTPDEYHPYAACLMFKACHNSETVRANLEAVRATPPAVVGEPVAVKAMGYGGSTGINDYLMSDGTVKAMRPAEVRWSAQATPQPTQAQAGAVPLNHKNIEPVRRFLADRGIYLSDETTKALIVAARGIKGGQHGAE
jgi:hypothetical protein